jgi:hypothetical protein
VTHWPAVEAVGPPRNPNSRQLSCLLRARHERQHGRTAEQRYERPSPHGARPSSGLGPHITTPLRKRAAVHHSKNCALMSQMGQLRSSEVVRRMTALTLEADLAGSRRDVSEVPTAVIAAVRRTGFMEYRRRITPV